jgi:uncharacterized protein (TIGR00725 family)
VAPDPTDDALNCSPITTPPSPDSPYRLSIGVMGAASGDFDEAAIAKSRALGRAIASNGCIFINGACPGLPFYAAEGAKQAGGLTLGISPALSRVEHVKSYGSPTENLDIIIYTGSGLMGREVTNIRSSDIVVIAGGRSGTLGEFAIAYDEGKLIGVLEGTGGITKELPRIVEIVHKETGAHLIYDADPDRLVKRLIDYYHRVHFRRPSVMAGVRPEAGPPPKKSEHAT